MAIMKIEQVGIGKALADKQLAVPVYQRSYAWKRGHAQDLFQDYQNALTTSESYFLGSIVAAAGSDRPEIVDGQQRLATTAILIAAIRDYFASQAGPSPHRDTSDAHAAKANRPSCDAKSAPSAHSRSQSSTHRSR